MTEKNRPTLLDLPELLEDARQDAKRFIATLEGGIKTFKEMNEIAVKLIQGIQGGEKTALELIGEMKLSRETLERLLPVLRDLNTAGKSIAELKNDIEQAISLLLGGKNQDENRRIN